MHVVVARATTMKPVEWLSRRVIPSYMVYLETETKSNYLTVFWLEFQRFGQMKLELT